VAFPDEHVVVLATFDFDNAPLTAKAVWQLLGRGPIESIAIHAMWAGRELAVEIPRVPEKISLENCTITPTPGDILYWHADAGTIRGYRDEVTELAIVYGPDTRMWQANIGECPGNVFAYVTENLDGLAEMGRRIRFEGVKKITLERLEE
jgi:hypothetical protein